MGLSITVNLPSQIEHSKRHCSIMTRLNWITTLTKHGIVA